MRQLGHEAVGSLLAGGPLRGGCYVSNRMFIRMLMHAALRAHGAHEKTSMQQSLGAAQQSPQQPMCLPYTNNDHAWLDGLKHMHGWVPTTSAHAAEAGMIPSTKAYALQHCWVAHKRRFPYVAHPPLWPSCCLSLHADRYDNCCSAAPRGPCTSPAFHKRARDLV